MESQSWSLIRSTMGVSRLVTFGQTPVKIDDALIDVMRTQSDSSDVVLRHFEPIEKVVVTDGPFVGIKSIYQMADSEGRGMVLINTMIKAVKMSVAPSSTHKVS